MDSPTIRTVGGKENLTFRARNPLTKKYVTKSFCLNKWDREEAEKIGTEWKRDLLLQWETQTKEDNVKWEPTARTKEAMSSPDVSLYPNITDDWSLDSFTNLLNPNTGNTIALIGSSKSGKTTFLKELYKKTFMPMDFITTLFSASLHADIYKDIPKSVVRASDYYPEIIFDAYKINKKTDNHYKFLFMLDDIVDQKENESLKKCFTIYRNSLISTILSVQDIILFKKTNRNQCNYYYFFKLNSDESITDVVKKFLTSYLPGKTIESKVNAYRKLTEDHYFLMLNSLDQTIQRGKLIF
jgi:hypothetical protein